MSLTVGQIAPERVIPVVVCRSAIVAGQIAQALVDGGIRTAEVTLRTPDALDSIQVMAGLSGFLVGAGTVLSADQVDAAVAAGASYIVSPGLSRAVVERCLELDVAVLPGVATATEVMTALEMGLSELKFFPAESCGGAAAVAALAGPFPDVSFVPTGGIREAGIADYLALGNVGAIGGTWLAPAEAQAMGDYDGIARRARGAVLSSRGEEVVA